MIEHIPIQVSNPEKRKTFYDKALAPIGYELLVEIPHERTGSKAVRGYGERLSQTSVALKAK